LYSVKELSDTEWRQFIYTSNQGNIFCLPEWCNLFEHEHRNYGVYKGAELQGGITGFETEKGFVSGGYPVTAYQGICVRPGLEDKYSITEALVYALCDKYDTVQIVNHYTMNDIRPMLWQGFTPLVRYTYLITDPALDKLEKDTRYEIQHNTDEVREITIAEFWPMYVKTFERKNMETPVDSKWMWNFSQTFQPEIYGTETSAAMVVTDWRRAYYIFGASTGEGNSLKTVWEVIKTHKEIDTAGANSKAIALYKRGLGGVLTPYLGATNAI
jgi:hypothetical protein